MTDTPETIYAALDDLTRRVAAFEQAQKKADVEPPVCSETLLKYLALGSCGQSDCEKAVEEIRYLRAELARLREGLEPQPADWDNDCIDSHANDPMREPGIHALLIHRMAREIQRHRALVTK